LALRLLRIAISQDRQCDHRDSLGKQGQIRVGQRLRPVETGPCSVQRSSLPPQLRIHPPNLLRRSRPARHPRDLFGEGRAALPGGGEGHRSDADARPGRGRRQDHRGGCQGHVSVPLQRYQRTARTPPRAGPQVLRGLQEDGEEEGRSAQVLKQSARLGNRRRKHQVVRQRVRRGGRPQLMPANQTYMRLRDGWWIIMGRIF
jgi:hypothetical protein